MAIEMTMARRMAAKKTRNLDLRMLNPPWRCGYADDPPEPEPDPPAEEEEGGEVALSVEEHPVVFFPVIESPSSEMENRYMASSREASPSVAVGDESWRLMYQYPVSSGVRRGHAPLYDPERETKVESPDWEA